MGRIAEERHDLRRMGPAFLRRHLQRGPHMRANVGGIGEVHMRRGTSDLEAVREVLRDGGYDLSRYPQNAWVAAAYERIVASGRVPLIIDAGANIGAAAMWFARRYPAARIIAVEPDPANAELCRRNAGPMGVDVVEAAVGCRPGTVDLLDDGMGEWGIQTVRGEGGVSVMTIPELMSRHADTDPFIVKIDIEGFEQDLFAVDTGWFAQQQVVFVEPHDWAHPGAGRTDNLRRVTADSGTDLLIHGLSLVFIRRPD